MSSIDDTIRDLKESWAESEKPIARTCSKCGQNMTATEGSEGKRSWACPSCGASFAEPSGAAAALPMWERAALLFVHGFGFSVTLLVLEIVWVFSTVLLVVVGSIIGLIIGLGLLVLMFGYLNAVLASVVWKYSMSTDLWSVFVQGALIVVLLMIIEVPLFLVLYPFATSVPVFAAKFLANCFVLGLLGQQVAERFTE